MDFDLTPTILFILERVAAGEGALPEVQAEALSLLRQREGNERSTKEIVDEVIRKYRRLK